MLSPNRQLFIAMVRWEVLRRKKRFKKEAYKSKKKSSNLSVSSLQSKQTNIPDKGNIHE